MRTLSLPSGLEVQLQEVSVKLAMDIASHSKALQEYYITQTLNQLQPESVKIDAATWSAEDRYFAMLDLYIMEHTEEAQLEQSLRYVNCHACSKDHEIQLYYPSLIHSFKKLETPLPEIEHLGVHYQLRPLNGAVMEKIEQLRLKMPNPEVVGESDFQAYLRSDQHAALSSALDFIQVAGYLGQEVEAFDDMLYKDFKILEKKVGTQVSKLRHGIDFSVTVTCPDTKGSPEVTRPVPFLELPVLTELF